MVLKRDIKELAAPEFDLAVSLFLPIRTVPDEKEKNRIRLKKLMKLAEEKAKAGNRYRAGIFDEAWRRLEEAVLFEGPETKGAAIFFSEKSFHVLRLPVRVGEEVSVADRYHIAPLLPALEPQGIFYVAALSLKESALFRCDKSGCVRIDKLHMPSFGAIRGQTELPADALVSRMPPFHLPLPHRCGSATVTIQNVLPSRFRSRVRIGGGAGMESPVIQGDVLLTARPNDTVVA